MLGVPKKIKPLFVKYFLVDYKLKIIEILYTSGGQYCSMFIGSATFEKISKNLEAEGRTDWKSKIKVYTSAHVLFSPLKIGEEQKKDLHGRRCPFFH